jgi:hypothetical protein
LDEKGKNKIRKIKIILCVKKLGESN